MADPLAGPRRTQRAGSPLLIDFVTAFGGQKKESAAVFCNVIGKNYFCVPATNRSKWFLRLRDIDGTFTVWFRLSSWLS